MLINQGFIASELGSFLNLFNVGIYQQKSIKVASIMDKTGEFNNNQGNIDKNASIKNTLSDKLGFSNLNFNENKNVIIIHKLCIHRTYAQTQELSYICHKKLIKAVTHQIIYE